MKKRAKDEEVIQMRVAINNPLLDRRQYEDGYINRKHEFLTAGIITEKLLSQIDDDGHQHLLVDNI